MSVRYGSPPPRLLPLLLLALLLLCLCLEPHGAEAKKKVKKSKQPTAVKLSVPPAAAPTAPESITVDVDAQASPHSLRTAALLADSADEEAVQLNTQQHQHHAMNRTTPPAVTALSTNTTTTNTTSSSFTNISTLSDTAALSSSSPSTRPTPSSSALVYPLIALGAVASTVCAAYLYYRFLRAPSSLSPPISQPLPLLRQLPPNHPQGRAQGSEWAIQQLRWDGDGDCAHDFLGPFAFASSSAEGKAQSGINQHLLHEQTAGGAE